MKMDLTTQRVCITGGGGFVGTHVVRALKRRGLPDDRLLVPRRGDYDLTIESEVARLYHNFQPDILVHLAATVGGIGEFFYQNLVMGVRL